MLEDMINCVIFVAISFCHSKKVELHFDAFFKGSIGMSGG